MREWPSRINASYSCAVFLDRDGTLNRDTHYPHRLSELQFETQALAGLLHLAELPVHIIVVSNQAGIAKGYFTVDEMAAFNAELRRRVQESGGRLDAFYYCPHLELKDLNRSADVCQCSKPNPGMLVEAAKDFGLDLSQCFVIGDKNSDIAAGQAVGATTIMVETGKGGRDEHQLTKPPDRRLSNLKVAAEWVDQRLGVSARQ